MKKSSTLSLIILLACLSARSLPSTPFPFYTDPNAGQEIRSNLYALQPDASTILLDGDLTQYDPSYSNEVDGMDARKMSNFSENLGMIRGTTTLVIERRETINVTDTIFYKLWNTHQANYQFEFLISNLDHPGLSGFLQDSYLNTSVPLNLNGSNYINFSVTADAASAAIYRFRVVFTKPAAAPLPLTFTSVKASELNNVVDVSWKTANETNVKYYNVEKSGDGSHFSSASNITAENIPANNYSWTDQSPASGSNYYRIRSTTETGEIAYSDVLKVITATEKGSVKVFPNPVIDNTIHLQLADQPAGLYNVKLVNSSGQSVMTKQIQHETGTSTETIRPAQHIPKGIYQLEVTKPGGAKINIQLLY